MQVFKLFKNGPFLCFVLFSALIAGAYLYYQPSWGVMDDYQHLQGVKAVWNNPNVASAFWKYLQEDLVSQKIRPVHCLYSFIVYHFFENFPLGIYLLNFVIQMPLLILWGWMFRKMFSSETDDPSRDSLFIFPLLFFVFTPFWNNFMYISLQEKFIFIFSTFSIFYFMRAYEQRRTTSLFAAFVFALLCLASKPTGIYLLVVLAVFSCVDLLFFRKNSLYSVICLAFTACVVPAYYFFMKKVVGGSGYSFKYVDNMHPVAIWNNLLHASIVIRLLFLLAVVLGIVWIILSKKKQRNPLGLLVPIAFIVYILILSPWGIINYFLAPVTPFAVGLVYPVYVFTKRKLTFIKLGFAPSLMAAVIAFFIATQVLIPRISKVADIQKVEDKIVELSRSSSEVNFFFPLPFMETHYALEQFTGTRIGYLKNGILEGRMLGAGQNLLIYRDECAGISLKNVKLGDVVYRNNTWIIYAVEKAPVKEHPFRPEFPKTFLQDLIIQMRHG